MSGPSAAMKRLVDGVLSRLPIPMLRRIETAAQFAQGKGWGDATTVDEVRAALGLLPTAERRRPVVLDVGANVGDWTAALLDAAPDATVHSFEPSLTAFGALTRRFADDERVHAVRAAAGDENGSARLWADAPGSVLASLSKRRLDHIGVAFDRSEEVPLLTLDSWCSEHGIHPVLLKLDVEGHELAALQGATEILRSVRVVQFEFGGCNIETRTYFRDFFDLFTEAGFRLHRLGPRGLEPVERYSELDETFTTTNFLAQRR